MVASDVAVPQAMQRLTGGQANAPKASMQPPSPVTICTDDYAADKEGENRPPRRQSH